MVADLQPWLANPEWAHKRISGVISSNVEMARGIWLSGAFALVLGAVGLVRNGLTVWNQKNPLGLLLLVFPLGGGALLYAAHLHNHVPIQPCGGVRQVR